jgi:hypothetical protein
MAYDDECPLRTRFTLRQRRRRYRLAADGKGADLVKSDAPTAKSRD